MPGEIMGDDDEKKIEEDLARNGWVKCKNSKFSNLYTMQNWDTFVAEIIEKQKEYKRGKRSMFNFCVEVEFIELTVERTPVQVKKIDRRVMMEAAAPRVKERLEELSRDGWDVVMVNWDVLIDDCTSYVPYVEGVIELSVVLQKLREPKTYRG
jgi:hypothetical protein